VSSTISFRSSRLSLRSRVRPLDCFGSGVVVDMVPIVRARACGRGSFASKHRTGSEHARFGTLLPMSSIVPTEQHEPYPELAQNTPEEVVQIRWLLLSGGLNEAALKLIDAPLYHYLELAHDVAAGKDARDVALRNGAHASFVQQLTEPGLDSDVVDACVFLAHSAAHRADAEGRRANPQLQFE
jgi:hypothetical protein